MCSRTRIFRWGTGVWIRFPEKQRIQDEKHALFFEHGGAIKQNGKKERRDEHVPTALLISGGVILHFQLCSQIGIKTIQELFCREVMLCIHCLAMNTERQVLRHLS